MSHKSHSHKLWIMNHKSVIENSKNYDYDTDHLMSMSSQ